MKSPLRAERDEESLAIGDETVVIAYDPDGESWFVATSSVPGLAADADSREALLAMLPDLIRLSRMP